MSADKDTQDWLDGLAGKAGEGSPAHRQGERLRRGLERVPEPTTAPDWADVRARAGLASPVSVHAPAVDAANAPRWRLAGLAASVGVATLLGWQLWPAPAPEDGWRGTAGASTPVWRTADPAAASAALAQELGSYGATVIREATSGGWVLGIHCQAPCDARVGARLTALETALDADGRVVLRVLDR